MSDDELFDDELRAGLAGLATGPDDADAALAGMRPRARRARARRRTRVVAGAGAVALLFVGMLATLSDNRSNGIETTPANPGDTSVPAGPSTTTSGPPTTVTTTTMTTPATNETTPDVGGTTPTSAGDENQRGPDETNPSTSSPSGPGDVPPSDYTSVGGTITVAVVGGRLRLDDVVPANGYTEKNRDVREDRIRLDFERDDSNDEGHEVRIELRIEDGRVVSSIEN